MPHPHQLILCDGPRCCRDPEFAGLVHEARNLQEAQPRALEVTSYPCLGRCGAGPNLLMRKVSALGEGDPGYRDLDGTTYYHDVSARSLVAIVRAHCDEDAAAEGGEPF